MKLKAIRYYGGKSADKSGTWIASKIPVIKRTTYIETHAGMLGVLLLRPRVNCEIANDLNSRLMNFWDVLRTQREALVDLARYTPHARELFDRCLATIDEGDDLERAWKYFVVITQSLTSSDAPNSSWTRNTGGDVRAGKGTRLLVPSLFEERLEAIGKRIRRVQLDNCPAITLLERFVDDPDTVIYVDPPYADTNNEPYAVVRHDTDAMFEVLRQMRGRVAISGFDHEWDGLGWLRHERVKSVNVSKARTRRLEVLWTNYELEPRLIDA